LAYIVQEKTCASRSSAMLHPPLHLSWFFADLDRSSTTHGRSSTSDTLAEEIGCASKGTGSDERVLVTLSARAES